MDPPHPWSSLGWIFKYSIQLETHKNVKFGVSRASFYKYFSLIPYGNYDMFKDDNCRAAESMLTVIPFLGSDAEKAPTV